METISKRGTISEVDRLGFIGEAVVEEVLTELKVAHETHLTKSNWDFEGWKLNTGENPDATIYRLQNNWVLIEVKNNSGKYDINVQMVERDILSRFRWVDQNHKSHWLLIVAHPTIRLDAQQLLSKERVHWIATHVHATDGPSASEAKQNLKEQLRDYLLALEREEGRNLERSEES